MVYRKYADYSLDELLIVIFSNHELANSNEMDGRPCYFCNEDIPLVKKYEVNHRTGSLFLKVDRGNRVDFNLTCGNKRLVTSHIKCWFVAVMKSPCVKRGLISKPLS